MWLLPNPLDLLVIGGDAAAGARSSAEVGGGDDGGGIGDVGLLETSLLCRLPRHALMARSDLSMGDTGV